MSDSSLAAGAGRRLTQDGDSSVRHLGQARLIALSAYWVSIGYLWQALGTLVIPFLIERFVGVAHQGLALSVLEGIGTLLAVIWQPLCGMWSDGFSSRYGRRYPFMFVGTASDLVFLFFMALAGAFWWLAVAYLLLQASSNSAQAPYQGLLPDVVPEDERAQASGYYGVANLVGILTGTVVAGIVLGKAGVGASLFTCGAVLVIGLVITAAWIREPQHMERREKRSPASDFFIPLRNRPFFLLTLSRLFILMGIVGIQSFTLFFFTDAFFPHDASRAISSTYTLVGLVVFVALLVTWPAARLSDITGRRPMIVASGLVSAAGNIGLIFSHSVLMIPAFLLDPAARILHVPDFAAQAAFMGLFIGLGFGAFLSVDWVFLMDYVPAEKAALFMAFSNVATAGSGIVARFAGGFLLDFGDAHGKVFALPAGYPLIFAVFAAWMVIGSLVIAFIPEGRANPRKMAPSVPG